MKYKRTVAILAPLLVLAGVGGWFAYQKLHPAPAITHILCMGDSITASDYGDYTAHMTDRFRESRAPIEVTSAARPGNTSGEYLRWMRETGLLERTNPHLVVLMLGTNDARVDGDHTPTPLFVKNMHAILDRIAAHHNPDTTTPAVILATVPPIPEPSLEVFNQSSQRRVEKEINPAIRQLARQRRLHLADVHGFFRQRIELMSGVHPTPQGYSALGDFLFREARVFLTGQQNAPEKERLPDNMRGTIAFESNRDGNFDIYLMNTDGVRRLTRSPARDGFPSFSPTFDRIAFESDRSGRFEIHTIDRSGRIEKLFASPTRDRSPWWTLDGKYIYFDRLVDGKEQVFRFHLEKKKVEAVTSGRHRTAVPTVSPDGNILLATGHRHMGWDLLRIDLSDGKESVFTPGYGGCRAKYSHSGEYVAFVSHKFDKRGDIILTPAAEFSPTRLTVDGDRHDYYPAFSVDDRHIVYASGPQLYDGNYDLCIVEIATRRTWTITNHPATDYKPVWGEWGNP
ncbi:MAG TPA: hypothetical protein ENN40_00880 [Candidatus Aminicenantes bacterium]|nr:hypothetical protein [Candidatus Aminicenantes bacterium]